MRNVLNVLGSVLNRSEMCGTSPALQFFPLTKHPTRTASLFYNANFFQNTALCATGAIWTRYCLVITPVNYYLSSVNFFVMCCGLMQLCRIAHYRVKYQHFLRRRYLTSLKDRYSLTKLIR
ncbi:hypothetical protein GCK32_021905 [Trichostrongylus colubriformis]|uniref:Mitochondrial pyruvate carrier n=1 Tax=Trichostrongylus colubriformis TaxID=6319 RepID=A0AAN8FCF5_TRICO